MKRYLWLEPTIEHKEGTLVSFADYAKLQADLDLVLGEAIKWAEYVKEWGRMEWRRNEAAMFLKRPEVQAWRERQKETNGKNSANQ